MFIYLRWYNNNNKNNNNNNNDNNYNNNNNTLKVIYSSILHNYQYSTWSLVHDYVRECVRWFID